MQPKYKFALVFGVLLLLSAALVVFGIRHESQKIKELVSKEAESIKAKRLAYMRLHANEGDWLPPPNVPLVSVIDQLKRESDAGNARASCRLSVELLRCSVYESNPRVIEFAEKELAIDPARIKYELY
jgi:hypothetical protein